MSGVLAEGVVAEQTAEAVLACFTAYEAALVAGDPDATDAWFADDARTVRFGVAEEQWGAQEVRAWRRTAPPLPPGRHLTHTRVDVWTDELAVVTTLFDYPGHHVVGRQSQVWRLTDVGWRIIQAHVSERAGTA